MGVLMIAMAWPWGTDLPVVPQVVLFSVGALWFVAAAPFRARGGSRGRVVIAALPHVVMVGAMAWMVSAMGSSGTAPPSSKPGRPLGWERSTAVCQSTASAIRGRTAARRRLSTTARRAMASSQVRAEARPS
ncbi:DUF5134 domain-containing protein [Streptomyces canus]|uniref:DUF5134 domain-containing protein n=1 Tax=Streptomyces canus TaxID=58343 RepID=UPI0037DA607C